MNKGNSSLRLDETERIMGRMSVISNGRRAIPVQPVAAGPQKKQLYISGNLFASLVAIAMVDSIRR